MSLHEAIICNTTPVRYFALVDQVDVLVGVLGGEVCVPRQVLDLDEDADGIESLVSEIAQRDRKSVV